MAILAMRHQIEPGFGSAGHSRSLVLLYIELSSPLASRQLRSVGLPFIFFQKKRKDSFTTFKHIYKVNGDERDLLGRDSRNKARIAYPSGH